MGIIDFDTGLDLDEARVAHEIADREDFSTLIIDSSIDGILALDLEGRYTLWNKAMEKISGVKKEALLGKNAFDFFPFLKETGMDKAFAEAVQGKTVKCPPIPFEVVETGAKGFTEQTNVPICNEHGKIVGVLSVVRDITETKTAMNELEQKNRELEERLRAYEAR